MIDEGQVKISDFEMTSITSSYDSLPPDLRDKKINLALCLAVDTCNVEMVRYLLAQGAPTFLTLNHLFEGDNATLDLLMAQRDFRIFTNDSQTDDSSILCSCINDEEIFVEHEMLAKLLRHPNAHLDYNHVVGELLSACSNATGQEMELLNEYLVREDVATKVTPDLFRQLEIEANGQGESISTDDNSSIWGITRYTKILYFLLDHPNIRLQTVNLLKRDHPQQQEFSEAQIISKMVNSFLTKTNLVPNLGFYRRYSFDKTLYGMGEFKVLTHLVNKGYVLDERFLSGIVGLHNNIKENPQESLNPRHRANLINESQEFLKLILLQVIANDEISDESKLAVINAIYNDSKEFFEIALRGRELPVSASLVRSLIDNHPDPDTLLNSKESTKVSLPNVDEGIFDIAPSLFHNLCVQGYGELMASCTQGRDIGCRGNSTLYASLSALYERLEESQDQETLAQLAQKYAPIITTIIANSQPDLEAEENGKLIKGLPDSYAILSKLQERVATIPDLQRIFDNNSVAAAMLRIELAASQKVAALSQAELDTTRAELAATKANIDNPEKRKLVTVPNPKPQLQAELPQQLTT